MSVVRRSQNALLQKLAAHRPRVPPDESEEFERGLFKIESIAEMMNSAVDELMGHVANPLAGKHFGGEVTKRPVECHHVGHPPHVCPKQRPTCGNEKCWCVHEFRVGKEN